MIEAENQQLTVEEALDWYVREFLVGKKRDRTIDEYQNDYSSYRIPLGA